MEFKIYTCEKCLDSMYNITVESLRLICTCVFVKMIL